MTKISVRRHQPLILLLFFLFLLHLIAVDRNSYWYDELLSVKVYGTDPKTAASMVHNIYGHPPLYHLILYYWIRVFGATELATRLLSSIYILLSTLFLYLLVKQYLPRRVALATIFLYGLSYGAIYYALQARPYAQTLFLATLSSFLLWRLLKRIGSDFSWKSLIGNRNSIFLMLCNIALLLTHYYNAFFIMAQASFVVWYLATRAGMGFFYAVLKVSGLYLIQTLPVIVALGPLVVSLYKKTLPENSIEVPTDPLSMILRMVVEPHFPFLPIWLLLLLLVSLLVYGWRIRIPNPPVKENTDTASREFFVYLLFWMIAPCVILYLVFFATGFEKLKWRYIIYCLPPLAALLALAVNELVGKAFGGLAMVGLPVDSRYVQNATTVVLAAFVLVTVPGAYVAVTTEHGSFYRESAMSIVNLVEHNPRSSYVIYEAGRRPTPLLNHYFERFSKRVRATGVFTLTAERRGKPSESLMVPHDYLIIAFTHLRQSEFPQTLTHLSRLYDLYVDQIDRNGKGYKVFKKRL